MAKRQRRKVTDEYKAEAVRLVVEENMAVTQAARDSDLTEFSLRNWARQAQTNEGKGPAIARRQEAGADSNAGSLA